MAHNEQFHSYNGQNNGQFEQYANPAENFDLSQTFENQQSQHNKIQTSHVHQQNHHHAQDEHGEKTMNYQEEFVETDPDFFDQSLQELGNQDTVNKDLHNREQMGFDRKFQSVSKLQQETSNPALQRKLQQGIIDNLDIKAQLHTPIKGISNYHSKSEVVFRLEEGHPVQLIYQDTPNHWVLGEEANRIISEVQGPVSFISIAGLPKSGKTFLVNSLIQSSTDPNFERFRSGDDHDQRSKGLVMWSTPLFNHSTGSSMFFIDSQEYPALEKRGEQQSYQMIINCLISSILLLNTTGELSSQSLLPLSDIYHLQEFIDLDQDPEVRDEVNFNSREELAILFPKLLFVIRDFKDVIKKNGKNISCQQYLSNFLEDDEAFHKGSVEEKKIRRRIIKYFKIRDACSLVPPVRDASQLSHLDRTDVAELDPKFQEGLRILRKKIIQYQTKKEFRGVFFTSTMMISFINSILEDINESRKIGLIKAYQILIENEFICIYNNSVDIYNESLGQQFADETFKSFKDLLAVLRQAREATLDNFYKLKSHETPQANIYFEKYHTELLKMIEEKEALLIQFNTQLQQKMITELEQKQFHSTSIDEIKSNYNVVLKKAFKECLGGNPDEEPVSRYAEKVMDEVTILMKNELKENMNKGEQEKKKLIASHQKELQDKAKILEDEKKKQADLKKEYDTKIQNLTKEKDDKLKKDLESEKDKHQKENKELQAEIDRIKIELDEEKKKSKNACCEIF